MLRLPVPIHRFLVASARIGYPREACGVLVGHAEGVVVRAPQVLNRNVGRARDRYRLDPDELLAADTAARDDGLEILGIWHTHPDHPAVPSETDRRAAWPDWSYVILAVGAIGVIDVRSWRLAGDTFQEEPLKLET